MLSSILYSLLLQYVAADVSAAQLSSAAVVGEDGRELAEKGERMKFAKSYLLRGGSTDEKESLLALESLKDIASNHLKNVQMLQHTLRDGDNTGFVSALKTTLKDTNEVLQVASKEDDGILQELTQDMDLDDSSDIVSSIDTYLEDNGGTQAALVDMFQSQSGGSLNDMTELLGSLVNALDTIPPARRLKEEDEVNLFSHEHKSQGSYFEFDDKNGYGYKFKGSQDQGNWKNWQQFYQQKRHFMHQQLYKGKNKSSQRRGSFPDISSFIHRGNKVDGKRRRLEVQERHTARRTALMEEANQCLPKCQPSDWKCNCQNLFKCVGELTDYDAVMMIVEGYVDTDPTSSSYANFTVDPDELDVFISEEGIHNWLSDLKELASQVPTQSTCSEALIKVYTTCPFGEDCSSANDQTHHLSVEDVCNSVNHDHKLYFEAIYEEFDEPHPPSSGLYCGSTAYASCAQLAAAMEELYEYRDKQEYPTENPLKKSGTRYSITGVDQGSTIYQSIQFPYEYVYYQSEEGIKTIVFPPNSANNLPSNEVTQVQDTCSADTPCSDGSCCSQYNFCGTTDAYCGSGCQSNCGGPWTPTKRPDNLCNFEKYSPAHLDPIQFVSKEDGRLLKVNSCNYDPNDQLKTVLVATENRTCDAGTVWYYDPVAQRIYSALCEDYVIRGVLSGSILEVGPYDSSPSEDKPQALNINSEGIIQILDGDDLRHICLQDPLSSPLSVEGCLDDDSKNIHNYIFPKIFMQEAPSQDPYKFLTGPLWPADPPLWPDGTPKFPGNSVDVQGNDADNGQCLSSQFNTTVAKEGMAMCDTSMKFLLGNLMSLGTLQAIANDIKENGPGRMPGRCCLDSSTTSEWYGQSYDSQDMQCQFRGPWYLGLSSEVCEGAMGLYERSPCYRLQECINNRPQNGTAGYSQSFEDWAQQLVIEDPNDQSECGNTRSLLGYENDYPYDTEVCQTFEDDICDPYFDTLDSLAPPVPTYKNVSYDPIQFDTGDVPFDKLIDLKPWKDADAFGSYDGWGGWRQLVLSLENVKVASDMNWKKAKDNEKLCNLIPVFELAPEWEFVKVACIRAAQIWTKISFILNWLAVLAYQTTKHIFESKKIGAGEMWSMFYNTEAIFKNMDNFNFWMNNSTNTINNNIHLQHNYMLQKLQETHTNMTNYLGEFIQNATNALGCQIFKELGGECTNQPTLLGAKPPTLLEVKWPDAHANFWSKIDTMDMQIRSIQEVILDPKSDAKSKKSKKAKQAKPATTQEESEQENLFSRNLLGVQEAVTYKFDEMKTDIVAAVKEEVKSVENQVKSVKSKFESMESQVESMEGTVVSMNVKVDSMEGKIESMESKVESIEGKVESVEGKVESIEKSIGEMKEMLSQLLAKGGVVG